MVRDLLRGEAAIRSLIGVWGGADWSACGEYAASIPLRTERLLSGTILGDYLEQT